VVALNYLTSNHTYSEIHMFGGSGGGWTTVLAAALDTRITRSVSSSGSLPLEYWYWDSTKCPADGGAGDAEQKYGYGSSYPSTDVLYHQGQISYFDLYIMAGSPGAGGAARGHLQLNQKYDTCCFYGERILQYADFLKGYVQSNSLGDYEYYLDNSYLENSNNLGFHAYNLAQAYAPGTSGPDAGYAYYVVDFENLMLPFLEKVAIPRMDTQTTTALIEGN
jgi:hypothetical protein